MTLEHFNACLGKISRAAFGIMLGASLPLWGIEGSRGMGWPVGSQGLEHAAVTVTAIALAVWCGCWFRRR
jgi:hypothetical protein